VEYANHDHFIAIFVEFMNDDVRQARHRPFIGAGDDPDAAELGEFAEPIGLGKVRSDYYLGRSATIILAGRVARERRL
jgi:hypothetical protein